MKKILQGLIWIVVGLQVLLLMFILFSKVIFPKENNIELTKEDEDEINSIIMPEFTKTDITEDIARRMYNKSYRENENISLEDLAYLKVAYYDYQGNKHLGELVANKVVADDLLQIFKELYEVKYPIYQMKLVDEYDGVDFDSIEADNTSAFNYRTIDNSTELSKHAYGLAIDINPLENPYVLNGVVEHESSEQYINRNNFVLGMITPDDDCVRIFKEHGWTWGGDWITPKDYQHFEKEIDIKKK